MKETYIVRDKLSLRYVEAMVRRIKRDGGGTYGFYYDKDLEAIITKWHVDSTPRYASEKLLFIHSKTYGEVVSKLLSTSSDIHKFACDILSDAIYAFQCAQSILIIG